MDLLISNEANKNLFQELLRISFYFYLFIKQSSRVFNMTRYFVIWPVGTLKMTHLITTLNLWSICVAFNKIYEWAKNLGLGRLGRCPSQCERRELGLGDFSNFKVKQPMVRHVQSTGWSPYKLSYWIVLRTYDWFFNCPKNHVVLTNPRQWIQTFD